MIRTTLLLPVRLAALAAMVATRRAARALGRALDVPYGASIIRPAVTHWAVERRPPQDGWPMRYTLHHDDPDQLSAVTVWEPLRWGPVVLVCHWDPEGPGDVWVLRASGELVTVAGIGCLKDHRAAMEAVREARWAAEMEET